ncbi:hypothetical protein FE374_11450 [Georgenia yuyongxinii]|uniref:DUF5666 domain-containing protein n=1 Tax=Georgenia yuyongxinii TaxID=2589797 RepID=A0A5B8C3M0_9MICO|nr:hypothetical protein [Georgenia yuyongxinii]QDC25134.1 hypothetical protein FE374_11450 [Georgenia yuyongxinii]
MGKLRGAGVAAAVAGAVMVSLAASGAWAAPPARPVTTELRSFQAAVNIGPDNPLLPDDGGPGYVGSVSVLEVLGGATSVNVFLSRGSEDECPDGGPVSSSTITTGGDATLPGPVTLDINRRLRTAHADAVVDLQMVTTEGCGTPEVSTPVPAQHVSIDVTGTSVRFRTGVTGSVSSGADVSRSSSVDLSRDGFGSATVGEVGAVEESAAFLRYAEQRTFTRGTPPTEPPANVAPAGGTGAEGRFTLVEGPEGEIGTVTHDVILTATVSAPPERAETITADVIETTVVACPDGRTLEEEVTLRGDGPGTVDIPGDLARASAHGTLDLARTRVDACTGEETSAVVPTPVALALDGTGPAVRVEDTRFQVVPRQGRTFTRNAYTARDAAGQLTVGDMTGDAQLASISQAALTVSE